MKIQTFAKSVGDNGCLALCYLYIACLYTNTEWNDFKALQVIKKAMELGYIEDDCYVKNPAGLMKLAVGRNFNVRKIPINESRGVYVAMRYEYVDDKNKSHGHWTVWNVNDGLVWNSLDYSNCVSIGNPCLNDVREVVIQ